jgi:pimeloyl-ACP methyl ester carboxylesterase
MDWRTMRVDGRTASYGVAGDGPLVVFLHGWGVSHRTYRHGLELLVGHGVRVLAPALPGFAGTAPLPDDEITLQGYAEWVAAFLEEYGVEEAVTLIGHSFGGGVALHAAHLHPDLVGRLVLVNSIGGSVWTNRGELPVPMADRPMWDWGLHIAAHALSVRSFTRVMSVIAADAVPNFVLHPTTLWKVGRLARDANLAAELEELKERGLPVVIVWGRDDTVIPWACAESLAVALGKTEVVTVPGNHSWLLADPTRFAEVITNVIGIEGDEETQAS